METSTSTTIPNTASSPERLTIEQLENQSTEARYILAAARASNRWLPGQELTQEQFDRALAAVKGVEVK